MTKLVVLQDMPADDLQQQFIGAAIAAGKAGFGIGKKIG